MKGEGREDRVGSARGRVGSAGAGWGVQGQACCCNFKVFKVFH